MQERLLRHLYLADKDEHKMLLEIRAISRQHQKIIPHIKVQDFGLSEESWWYGVGDFLGKRELSPKGEGVPPLFVSWCHSPHWSPGHEALYFDPETLGLESIEYDGKRFVPLEELCWVLEPELLWNRKPRPFDSNWDNPHHRNSEDVLRQMKYKTRLAEYLEAQLELYAHMCQGMR